MHKETKCKTIAYVIFLIFSSEVLLSLGCASSYYHQMYSRKADRDNNDKTAKEYRHSLNAIIAFDALLCFTTIALLYFLISPEHKGMTVTLIITYLLLVGR